MKTVYDVELLSCLKNSINEGLIKIYNNNMDFFDALEKNYPVGFSGINWSEKEYIYFADVKNKSAMKQKLINDFLQKIVQNHAGLSNEKIITFGDGLTNLSFEMKFVDFVRINECFFNIPQHTYVWFEGVQKCINLTFEDELYFG